MKVVMAREVERFLFRPGLQERARYYGVIFLNQMPLSHNTKEGKHLFIFHRLWFCCALVSDARADTQHDVAREVPEMMALLRTMSCRRHRSGTEAGGHLLYAIQTDPGGKAGAWQ